MNKKSKKLKEPLTIIKPLNVKAEKLSSFFKMFKGLMFSRRKNAKAKLFIFPCELPISIHMLCVFFPLIIVWIDKNKKITNCYLAKPFCFYKVHKAKYVLEIPYTKKTRKFLKMKGKQLKWD